MKSKGYTFIEMAVVMIVTGIIVLVVFLNTSYAFVDRSDEHYEDKVNMILIHAKEYGKNSDTLKRDNAEIVTVHTLIESGYLVGDENNLIMDPRNAEETLNDLEIMLKLNSEGEVVATLNE